MSKTHIHTVIHTPTPPPFMAVFPLYFSLSLSTCFMADWSKATASRFCDCCNSLKLDWVTHTHARKANEDLIFNVIAAFNAAAPPLLSAFRVFHLLSVPVPCTSTNSLVLCFRPNRLVTPWQSPIIREKSAFPKQLVSGCWSWLVVVLLKLVTKDGTAPSILWLLWLLADCYSLL